MAMPVFTAPYPLQEKRFALIFNLSDLENILYLRATNKFYNVSEANIGK
jgi:hypothetical protein